MLESGRALPRVWEVRLLSPTGDVFELTDPDSDVWLADGGVQGLVSTVQSQGFSGVGVIGQVFSGLVVEPLVGSLSLHVRDAVALARLRAGLSARVESSLVVHSPGFGMWSCGVRLSAPIGAPARDPLDDGWFGVSVELVGDGGVWWSPVVEVTTPTVTVTNFGDVPVHPKIRWKGAGGVVKLPSGASFTLPPAKQTRVLDLRPTEMLAVRDEKGTLDRELWLKIRGRVLPEGVPVDESRTFTIPKGAALVWRVGVFDPWR